MTTTAYRSTRPTAPSTAPRRIAGLALIVVIGLCLFQVVGWAFTTKATPKIRIPANVSSVSTNGDGSWQSVDLVPQSRLTSVSTDYFMAWDTTIMVDGHNSYAYENTTVKVWAQLTHDPNFGDEIEAISQTPYKPQLQAARLFGGAIAFLVLGALFAWGVLFRRR